jgi:anti-sigma regulatory factor (Ser/Thr protein kinase)
MTRPEDPAELQSADAPAAEFTRRVPAVPAEIGGIRRAVLALADARGAAKAAQADIALAVSEACANVVLHAYLGDPEPGPLTAEAYHDKRELVVVITDEGRGMAPRPDSPGLGLGLPLITRLAERVEISDYAPTGTEVRMTFAIDPGH